MVYETQTEETAVKKKKSLFSRPIFWVSLVLFVIAGLIAIPVIYVSQMISEGSNWAVVMEAMTSDFDSYRAGQEWLDAMDGAWVVAENDASYVFTSGNQVTLNPDGERVSDSMQAVIAGDNYAYIFLHANEPGDDLDSLMKYGEFYEVSFDGSDRMIWTGPHNMLGRSLEKGNVPLLHLSRVE